MRAREHGFTLIELIAVILVLAIAAGLASARMGVGRGNDVLQATAYQIASRCRAARTAAIRRGSQEVVLFDLAKRVVRSDAGTPSLNVSPTITMHSQTSMDEQRSQSVAGIRFLPNGSSSGGMLRLEAGHRAYEVRVNWFTGRVTVERTS